MKVYAYSLFDTTSGEILGKITSNSTSLPDTGNPSVGAVLGDYPATHYYVDTALGQVLPYTESAVLRKGSRRGPYAFWSNKTFSWEVPFALLCGQKLQEIKHARSAAEFASFNYNGMTFDGDADAQRRLSGLVSAAKSTIAAGQTFTKEFTLADNSVVQLTAEDFVGIEMAKIWQVDVAFQEYRLKKAAIEAATTIEELEAATI